MSIVHHMVFDEMDSILDVQFFGGSYTSSTGIGLSTTIPPEFSSGKSLQITGTSSRNITLVFDTDQAGKTLYAQVYFRYPAGSSGNILAFSSSTAGGTNQIALVLEADGTMNIQTGTTIIASGTVALTADVFHVLDLECLVAGTGGVFKLYVNGNSTADIDFSGDTQNQASNSVLSFVLGYSQGNHILNSLYFRPIVFNSDGTKNNGRVPFGLLHEIRHATSDGASTWTPDSGATAYTQIDDSMGQHDDDTSYVKNSANGTVNRGGIASVTGVDSVVAIAMYGRARKVGPGVAGIKFGTKTSGGTDTQTTERFLTGSYVDYRQYFEYKTGSTEFVEADLSGMELTIERTSV